MAIRISKNKLLLVEGNHEVQFFAKLLQSMQIDNIQVEPVGGQYNFKPSMEILPKLDNFDNVRAIGIIRDADDSFEDTFSSVQGALRDAGLPVPNQPLTLTGNRPQVAVFITPDNNNRGDLEELCLASVQDDPILECVERYFDCLRPIQGTDHPHISKARMQVFLAKEPDGDIHMGIASRRGIWDWNSQAFDEIKTFVRSLSSI